MLLHSLGEVLDGDSSHFCNVRKLLNEKFAWHPRSPDLIPLYSSFGEEDIYIYKRKSVLKIEVT
jgi:hypothetical protein